jgi:hydrogenase maturation protease
VDDRDGAAGRTSGTTRGDAAPASRVPPALQPGDPPALQPGDRVLLLGIGNDLRGDDGAGPRVARALEGRVPWDVRAVHGLTPELADDLAEVDLALFVDAHADVALARPTWSHHRVEAATPGTPLLGHTLDVPALLALTAQLHGHAPRAATLSLPARDFALGETLSPTAGTGVDAAIAALRTLARG